MWFLTAFRWCVANPKPVAVAGAVIAALIFSAWLYHRGAAHEAATLEAKSLKKSVTVKEQYDAIARRRPSDNAVLELLRRGAF